MIKVTKLKMLNTAKTTSITDSRKVEFEVASSVPSIVPLVVSSRSGPKADRSQREHNRRASRNTNVGNCLAKEAGSVVDSVGLEGDPY